jgi:hypothetical protein
VISLLYHMVCQAIQTMIFIRMKIYRIMGKAITLLFGKNVIMIKMEADLRVAYTIR